MATRKTTTPKTESKPKATSNPPKAAQPKTVQPKAIQPKVVQSEQVTVKYKSMHSIQFELNGKPIKINGSNEDLRGKSSGVLVTDYGTTVLDRQTWEAVESKYGSMSIFKNGLIFAYGQAASADARAKEQAALKTDFAPAAPLKDK